MIVRKETNLTEKIKSKTLFQSEIEIIINSEESNKELAHRYNVSKRTIQRVKAGLIDGIEDEDYQLCDESIKMKYQLQRSREANQRINKTNRETFRIADLIQTMTDEFIEVVTIGQDDVRKMLLAETIFDAKTLSALYMYFLRKEK